jgi:argonaute-like protein implicated in RNA metabolism and viral defense
MFQLVWPRTYGVSVKGVQDPATRAWNLFGALFYKAGGIPWKLQKPPGSHKTCYVGISFSVREEGGYMHSSLTQVFNDKGEGTILRGGIAHKSTEDFEVHLPKESARKLLADAIKNYAMANDKRLPDRVVIHKSSGYDAAETDGFNEAVSADNVRYCDLLALGRSHLRFFRNGAYPPLRGTHIILDENNSLLYTRGSVPFYRKYPGPYVPRSLHIRYFRTDRSQTDLAAEILALTKLNWNKTQFDSFYPITLGGSKQIGSIYKWCPDPPPDPIPYAFFM